MGAEAPITRAHLTQPGRSAGQNTLLIHRNSGAEMITFQPTLDLGLEPSASIVILLDVSSSMAELIGSRRRIDVLGDILKQVLPAAAGARLVAFNSTVFEVQSDAPLPQPAGSTELHSALQHVAPWKPCRVVVISDGEPSQPEAALAAARALGCEIVTYFAGDESNHAATAFLRALSWCSADGIGHTGVVDLRKPERLTAELKLQLVAPAS
jgi:hypothetical protein